jgi:hypothetical protein
MWRFLVTILRHIVVGGLKLVLKGAKGPPARNSFTNLRLTLKILAAQPIETAAALIRRFRTECMLE